MTLIHACIFIINLFIITTHAFMMVSGMMVERWLRSAVQDMNENNRTEILCPCQRCKEGVWLDPYEGGRLMVHLLMTGFMDGYTRWIIEDDDEDTDVAANDDTGPDEEMTHNGGGEGDEHGSGEEARLHDGGEEAGHGSGEGAGHGNGRDVDTS
jgi:hypothetical protein